MMTDNLRIVTILFFICSTICFIAYLISINSIAYDQKVKTINRYEVEVKFPDRIIRSTKDVMEK